MAKETHNAQLGIYIFEFTEGEGLLMATYLAQTEATSCGILRARVVKDYKSAEEMRTKIAECGLVLSLSPGNRIE